ncbi:MAG: DUF3450 domain-containing protein [Nevskia sp.]|nr:DUF3450 domain-containing protein [Gammaproteobacteria bacterium]MDH4458738.1 DUF3450 domain-containing protein [Nevskia sp.]
MASRPAVLVAAAVLTFAGATQAAKLGDVLTASDQWLVAQVDSQKKVDGLAEERLSLADEYRNSLREADSLKLYVQQLKSQLRSQEAEKEVVRSEIREIARTNIEILPLMQDMLGTFGQFVELDTPFLIDERRERVKQLNEMMPRADVTVSEKFRRILEGYQVEIDYGKTIEGYRGKLEGREVDFLRIGRVALMYQTPDAKETGYWDREKKGWVIDNSAAEGVKEGLKIARKQSSPDLMILPIQAASASQAAPAAAVQ